MKLQKRRTCQSRYGKIKSSPCSFLQPFTAEVTSEYERNIFDIFNADKQSGTTENFIKALREPELVHCSNSALLTP